LPENFEDFKELLLPFNKELSHVNARGLEIYNQQREELELDNFNLLYVALTRAVEQLYVITEKKISSKGIENTNFYSGVFINYLIQQNLWKDDVLNYAFGSKSRVSIAEVKVSVSETHQQFISTSWQDHNVVLLASASKLWNTAQGEAIDYGNLFHEILSKIYTEKDVQKVMHLYHQQGYINDEQKNYMLLRIEELINHPELNKFYAEDVIIYNEREIVDVDNQIVIPDRLVFVANKVAIIDYKTGAVSQDHKQQLLKYERVLQSMNFKVDEKLLVYINDNIDVVKV
jgi:hypothetical protein